MEEEVIKLSPDLKQLYIDCMGAFTILGIDIIVSILFIGHAGLLFYLISFLIVLTQSCIILERYLDMRYTRWLITDETLCKESGVLSRRKDYIELYRVIDYMEMQTFFQRIFGIKSVLIVSTDYFDRYRYIYGIPASLDLVKTIRDKVEHCKKMGRIYEIANN